MRRVQGRPAGPGRPRDRPTGTGRRPSRAGRRPGTRDPSPCGSVRTATASASGSSSAVAGSSPASIRVARWGATKMARSSASSDDRDRTISKKRAMFCSCSSASGVSVRDQPGEQAAAAQEPVEELAGRKLMGGICVAAQVGDQLRDRGPGLGRDAEDPGLALELLEDRPDRPVPAACHVDDRGQVFAAEAIDLRRREGVQVDARAEVGGDPQEREQQPDLRPRVEPGRPGEPPRDRGHVESPQDRVGVAVGPDEDRVVARPRRRPRCAGRSRRRSSRPPRTPWRRPRAGPGPARPRLRWARSRLRIPVRTSRRSGSLNRISR